MKRNWIPTAGLGMLLATFSAQSAEITKISKKKALVEINGGTDDGLTEHATVCFFKKETKGPCGKIKKAKKNKAIIQLSQSGINQVAKGDTAKPDGESAISAAPTKSTYSVSAYYAMALMAPSAFNNIVYTPAESGATTLWSSSDSISGQTIGFAGEFSLNRINLALGFRYMMYTSGFFQTPAPIDSDFVNSTTASGREYYVNNQFTSSSTMGFYGDYYLLSMFGLKLGAGLDIDMSSLAFSATKKDDGSNASKKTVADDVVLFSATSSLMAISLRLPIRYVHSMGSLSMVAGGVIIVPLMGTATTAVTVADEIINAKAVADPEQDFKDALGHKTAFGFELHFGLGYTF